MSVFSFSATDAIALGILLVGVLGYCLRRCFPDGLGASFFVAGVVAAATIAGFHHNWPAAQPTATVIHVTALLCPILTLLGRISQSDTDKAGPPNEFTRAVPDVFMTAGMPESRPPHLSTARVFQAWALLTGVVAATLLAYTMLLEAATRVLNPDRVAERLTSAGAGYLAALLLATWFWKLSGRHPRQAVTILVLVAMLIAWTSLMIPPAVGSYTDAPGARWPGQPSWWTWTFHVQIGLSLLLLAAAIIQELRYRTRRAAAWPDRLEDLLDPYSRWPGFPSVEAVLAALILLLGVYHIIREGPPSWPLVVGNMLTSAAAGGVCLFMTYRRWSANTTGLGIALLTLATVSLLCTILPLFGARASSAEYAVRLPTLFNAVLFALAVMIALWGWLAQVWDQQLLDGKAWTTTGRMIPYTTRAAFLLTALAVLIAFQMALWPSRPLTNTEDNSIGRIVAGLTALALLMLVSMRRALHSPSPVVAASTAGLCVAFLGAALLFLYSRLPIPGLRGLLRQYDAVLYGALAIPLLVLAEAVLRTRWRSFAGSFWWLGLLILPAAALLEVLTDNRPAAEWIRPATFALLSGVYLLAGRREHRRSMLVLGGVLLLAAITALFRTYGAASIL